MIKRPTPPALVTASIVIAVAAGVCASSLAFGADMALACPDSVSGTVVKASATHEGWRVSVADQMHLSAAGMSAGPPESELYLVPQRRTGDAQTFVFDAGDRERWFWCAYGGAGGVELARRLDDRATVCTVTNRKRTQHGVLSFAASIACRT